MTFTDIVTQVSTELGRTSTAAVARIGNSVNRRYKQICSDLGIRTVEMVLGVQVTTVAGTAQVTWNSSTTTPSTNVEKIERIYNPATTPPQPLIETSVDEIQNDSPVSDPATQWAPLLMGASSVTVLLNSTVTTPYALKADVLANVSTLSGTQVPAITEDFHDILYLYAKADELRVMEKYAFADAILDEAEGPQGPDGIRRGGRMGEYRLYIALSNHRKVYQGKNAQRTITSARIG